ncbi:MAG: DUF305 domain-containing protein [Actinomycetota bacterium]|nr:DUF305 domain-containing protein [Actinomycetota bacterium]
MSRRSLTLVSALAALALTAGLAACGDDSSDDTRNPAGTTAGAPAGADFGDADVLFAQSMIPHHEQAIEMADMALDPTVGAGAEVLDLAGRIKGAQDPEIELMTGWLTAWGMPLQMDTSDGHDMSSMDGMMSAEEMEALAASTGAEFDRLWLEMMVQHHEGAIAMADDVKADSSNAEVIALADAIIAGQQAEIDEMTALLDA